jgi:predicted DNA binding CopG/RHH family protein
MKTKHKYENDDTELWETRKLGASAKHAKRISEDEDKAIDDSLGLQAITMRLQKELVKQLKRLAKKEGLGYQPYIRQLLTRHVRETYSLPTARRSA